MRGARQPGAGGAGAVEAASAAAVHERWAALPALPSAWEKKMAARRDAALRVIAGEAPAADHAARIERGAESRREILLELEMALGLEARRNSRRSGSRCR